MEEDVMIEGKKKRYRGALDIPAKRVRAYAVEHVEKPAGTAFALSTARTAIIGGQPGGRVRYGTPTRWHQLVGPTGVWMTDYPIEQAQHDRALAPIRSGRVLVGGLGLGYAATVLARRPDVREVVVVEARQEVIDLVARHSPRHAAGCLAYLEAAGRRGGQAGTCIDGCPRWKVTVVRGDLLAYLRGLPASGRPPFDWAFYDVWQSDSESTFFLTVVPLLRASVGRVRRRPVCWNEDVMRGQLYLSLDSRWRYAAAVAAGHFERHRGALDLDALCEPTGSLWRDRSVPFFRWARRAAPDEAVFRELVALYAGQYGLVGFPCLWERVTGEPVPELDVEREVGA